RAFAGNDRRAALGLGSTRHTVEHTRGDLDKLRHEGTSSSGRATQNRNLRSTSVCSIAATLRNSRSSRDGAPGGLEGTLAARAVHSAFTLSGLSAALRCGSPLLRG